MAAAKKAPLFVELAEFLANSPDTDAIIGFKPSAALQSRASELLQKNRDATLNEEEARELDDYTRINELMSLIKAHARAKRATS